MHDRRTGGSGASPTIGKKVRPDAVCSGRSAKWMIDVSITNPTARSYLEKKGGNAGKAANREKQKHHDYDALARGEQAVLVPYVLESYGTLGKEARAFIRQLAGEAAAAEDLQQHENPKAMEKEFAKRVFAATSFALQRGNAHVSGQGCSRMRAAAAARCPAPS